MYGVATERVASESPSTPTDSPASAGDTDTCPSRLLTVRAASEDDCAILLQMEKACFRTPYGERALRTTLCQSPAKNFIALWDGEAVGYLLATFVAGESEILRIAVRENFRGRKIARAMLARLFGILPADTSYFLEVRKSNSAAIALYTACGFEAYAARKNYYRNPTEDACLMRRLPEKL